MIQESLVHLNDKWDDVHPDAWCKILYLEKDKVVQKFYILEREVTIDGKVGSEFDGERYLFSHEPLVSFRRNKIKYMREHLENLILLKNFISIFLFHRKVVK